MRATYDVIVIGAGLAGASAAAVLGRDGCRAVLIDPKRHSAPAFKAEKIEPHQADAFRRLRLMAGILPDAASISTISEAHNGRVLRVVPTEQYGIAYQDMVNAVRRQIPDTVDVRVARARTLQLSPDTQVVHLDTGEPIAGRLVVLTTGTGGRLLESLGFGRRLVRASHSLCSGFDVVRTDGSAFPFESLTYWADRVEEQIDYVTFFPIPGRMRVNLFSYRDPRDRWVRALATDPWMTLTRSIPGLARVTGEWQATSNVESRPIDLQVAETVVRDGIVLVGDAFQTVCPATGTGLSKVLTDVERLCGTYVGSWLSTPGMSATKIASFYDDAEKSTCDRHSLATAEHRRRFGTDRSLRWSLHRRKEYAVMAIDGLWMRQPT
jgi:2-polyprenyl-6-methoxyphenol hydroxylase-like FAD-dependent oxidoreductase